MKSMRLILAAAAALAGFAATTPAHAQTATAIYDGPVILDGTVRGTLNLTVKVAVKGATANWTFTGKALLQNATVTFSHKAVNLPLSGHIEIPAKTGEKLFLTYNPLGFSGTLSGGKAGAIALNVGASLNAFANKNNADAQLVLKNVRGLYNMGLYHGWGVIDGYMSLNVGNLGAVKIAGRLADGTAVSGSAKLVPNLWEGGGTVVAFHRPIYSKKGFLSGWLIGEPDQTLRLVDNAIPLCWESADPKRGIFTNKMTVVGGWYGDGKTDPLSPSKKLKMKTSLSAPLLPAPGTGWTGGWVSSAFPDIELSRAGGKLSIPKGKAPKKVGAAYEYEPADKNPSMAVLTFNPKTGLYKGNFKIFYDGKNAADKPQHKVVGVPYTGLVFPFGSTHMGDGFGMATINKVKNNVRVFLEPQDEI